MWLAWSLKLQKDKKSRSPDIHRIMGKLGRTWAEECVGVIKRKMGEKVVLTMEKARTEV